MTADRSFGSVDLYDNVYADFASGVEATVRRETYGEDLGQSSWLTAREWLEFADRLAIDAGLEVLEVGSGSSGSWTPAGPYPFPPVASTRWSRTARCATSPGGRALYTDAMVLTGIVSHEELAIRSSIGFYLFLPPGENERLLRAAGFAVMGVEDVTDNAGEVARRWHDARQRQEKSLVAREGRTNFDGLQRFLRCVHTLSVERRQSRHVYLAAKRALSARVVSA